MKKINKAQATSLTGEVMGWHDDDDGGYRRERTLPDTTIVETEWVCWIADWNPLDDLDQAKEMLEAICREKSWEANVLLDKDGLYHIDIQSEDDAGCGCCRETVTHGSAWEHKDLTTAIVLACLEAKFGVKYEIED